MSDAAVGSGRHLDLVTMGCRWVLDVSALDDGAAQAMADRWQRCRELASAATLVLDEERPTITAGVPADPYAVSRRLTRTGLQRLAGRVLLLHAAALADDGGRSLVLVAPSGGGKSTATRTLGRRLRYVSDESVILLEDHRIAPHPKPPSLVVDPEHRFRKEEPAPDELGLGPTPTQPSLGRLLALARDPEVTEPSIDRVGLVDQVLAVLPETSSTWLLEDGLHRLARAVTAGGPPARLRYSEIESCHDLVRDHLSAEGEDPPVWEHLPPTGADRWEGPAGGDDGEGRDGVAGPGADEVHDDREAGLSAAGLTGAEVLARGAWSDAIASDGEVLVLAGSRPLRLAGPGAVLWRAAAHGRTVEDLVGAVVGELGEHPDAGTLVREAAVELVRHGALRQVLR